MVHIAIKLTLILLYLVQYMCAYKCFEIIFRKWIKEEPQTINKKGTTLQ